MSTNTSIELTSLDFGELKDSFISFLRTQDRFKDLNFQGSNINTLLDILAYNTYHQSFYLNMLASEMFLDSAQLRASVVSHAKELNYLPRSFRSARALLNLGIETTDPAALEFFIPKNTTFNTTVNGNTYTFTTSQNIAAIGVEPGNFIVENLEVYEGVYLYESFVVDNSVDNQKFIISTPTIDTSSLSITVVEDGGEVVNEYLIKTSLFGLEPDSKVCFLQATGSGEYEISFGESSYVRKPKDGSVIIAEFRACSGELPNGADEFSTGGILGASAVSIVTSSAAAGGAVTETNEEIKFNAPRFFQTQERTVTASDYKTLLRLQYPEIRAITAYGGEETDPPQFGKVLISIDLQDAEGVTETKKTEYASWLKDRMPLSIEPVFIDPDFTYVQIQSTVRYNPNRTALTPRDIESLAVNAILDHFETNLNDFEKTFRYSKLVKDIDDADTSIISNDTAIQVYKLHQPTINAIESIKINFTNKIKSLTTSQFVTQGILCYIDDDGNSNLRLRNATSGSIISPVIGSVDYTTGVAIVNNINIETYTGSGLKFIIETEEQDIQGLKNNIVTVRGTDIFVHIKSERQS